MHERAAEGKAESRFVAFYIIHLEASLMSLLASKSKCVYSDLPPFCMWLLGVRRWHLDPERAQGPLYHIRGRPFYTWHWGRLLGKMGATTMASLSTLMPDIHWVDIVNFCTILTQITMHRVVTIHVSVRCDARCQSLDLMVVPFDRKICQFLCTSMYTSGRGSAGTVEVGAGSPRESVP